MRPSSSCNLAAALALGALLTASAARAAPAQAATAAIRQANDRLRSQLELENKEPAKRDQIRAQISREMGTLLDIPFLAQRSLVDHWAKMTPAQRGEVQSTLQAIIERKYLDQLSGNVNYKIEFLGEEPAGSDVVVKTVIHSERDGRPAKLFVNYQLHYETDHWRIYDVITEDVSTLKNYRGLFNRIIAKDGIEGLITKMKAKLEKGDDKADEKGKADEKPKADKQAPAGNKP